MNKQLYTLFAILLLFTNYTFSQEAYAPEEEIKLGMPSIEKQWHASDIANFNTYLDKKNVAEYPRLDNESSVVFNKLVESSKRELLPTIPLDLRITQYAEFQMSLVEVMFKYLDAFMEGEDLATELAYIQGMALETSGNILSLSESFLNEIQEDDPTYEARMAGFQRMKEGLATQISGMLTGLSDKESYSVEDRKITLTYMINEVGYITSFLEDSVVLEMHTRATELRSTEEDESLLALYDELLVIFKPKEVMSDDEVIAQ